MPSAAVTTNNPSPSFQTLGNSELLNRDSLGVLCSRKCPGSVILKFYDLLAEIRTKEITIVSGFHSPMEQAALERLTNSGCSFIVCPARGIERMRVPKEWKRLLAEGRMLIVSPFGETAARQSAKLAEERNRFVADLSTRLLIVHASPGSRLESLAATTQDLYTIDDPSNQNLFALGAKKFIP